MTQKHIRNKRVLSGTETAKLEKRKKGKNGSVCERGVMIQLKGNVGN
jgi:hypothetical protein